MALAAGWSKHPSACFRGLVFPGLPPYSSNHLLPRHYQAMAAAAAEASSSTPSTSSATIDAPPSYLLPYATLQPTYHDVYADILDGKVAAENVWLSVYAENAPSKSIHATLTLAAKEKADPSNDDEVRLENIKGQRSLVIKEEKAKALSGRVSRRIISW